MVGAEGGQGANQGIEVGKTSRRSYLNPLPSIDDLLWVIFLLLEDPTSLVCAAAVCRGWYRVISNPKFLQRFCAIHPPCLLGSCISPMFRPPKFVVSQTLSTDLTKVISYTRSYFSSLKKYRCGDTFDILDCRNGRVLIRIEDSRTRFQRTLAVCSPLMKKRLITPRCPPVFVKGRGSIYEFLPEDGGDGMTFYRVRIMASFGIPQVFVVLFTFKVGSWDDGQTSTLIDVPIEWLQCKISGLLVNGKFYMVGQTGYILGLDLVTMKLFLINLPNGVGRNYNGTIELSRANDSKFYLIHAKGLKLHVWLHDVNNNDEASKWILVDTIRLLEVFGDLGKPGWENEMSANFLICRGGDNAKFVYLALDKKLYLLHIKTRTLEKVFEDEMELTCQTFSVHPFIMMWLPTFEALDDAHDHDG